MFKYSVFTLAGFTGAVLATNLFLGGCTKSDDRPLGRPSASPISENEFDVPSSADLSSVADRIARNSGGSATPVNESFALTSVKTLVRSGGDRGLLHEQMLSAGQFANNDLMWTNYESTGHRFVALQLSAKVPLTLEVGSSGRTIVGQDFESLISTVNARGGSRLLSTASPDISLDQLLSGYDPTASVPASGVQIYTVRNDENTLTILAREEVSSGHVLGIKLTYVKGATPQAGGSGGGVPPVRNGLPPTKPGQTASILEQKLPTENDFFLSDASFDSDLASGNFHLEKIEGIQSTEGEITIRFSHALAEAGMVRGTDLMTSQGTGPDVEAGIVHLQSHNFLIPFKLEIEEKKRRISGDARRFSPLRLYLSKKPARPDVCSSNT